jgi:hypothetical protein
MAKKYGLQDGLSDVLVVALSFPCLYFALYLAVRQSRFALLLHLALSFINDFTAHIFPLHTHITYTLTTCNAIARGET